MLLLHAEAEQIWLGDDEVQILVIDLGNLFRGSGSSCLCCEVLQKWPGY